jgi:excinuclease ABC subunit A
MVSYTSDQILDLVEKIYWGKKIILLAPVVKSRKGNYQDLFQQIIKKGFIQCRIDGKICDINNNTSLERYKNHDIEIVIDKLNIKNGSFSKKRFKDSIETCFFHGNNSILIIDNDTGEARYFSMNLMCEDSGISYELPEPNNFSFNSPRGACKRCKGIGNLKEVDLNKLIPDENISIDNGGIELINNKKSWVYKQVKLIAKKFNFSLNDPIKKIPKKGMNAILFGLKDELIVENKTIGVNIDYSISFEGIYNFITEQYKNNESTRLKRWASNYFKDVKCDSCNGSRLKKESLYFKIDNKNINDIVHFEIKDLLNWINELPKKLNKKQLIISKELIKEIKERVGFLENVGLNYLTLNRSSKSLSGGESQRIRLASQIGSQLTGVLYILDEPSIGLHQSDNERLINSLVNLKEIGNSIIVVEHDKEMILNADHIIDIGPYAGNDGGEIIFSGTKSELIKSNSLTAKYINNKLRIEKPEKIRPGNGDFIELKGCTGNNLKNIDLKINLNTLTVVTGVSGSGKSTLINETLYPLIHNKIYKAEKNIHNYKSISGIESIDKIVNINQSPIGRTPRSNPATYCGVFSEIRNLFSKLNESVIRGYKAGRFSFNVSGGRCEECKGAGLKLIEMNFLPNVFVECEVCMSKRFNRETLEIKYKGKSINDVLEMSISEATAFFEHIPKIHRKLKTIKEVGLGYLTLGQQSTTLSGGEAQRIKLATELSKRDTGNTLYVLDEPTTGLHFEDIRILLLVIEKLISKGNTVIIIEHNMDVIKRADYIIDLGPEGGKNGGEILFQGNINKFLNCKKSSTSNFLKKELT